MFIMEKSLSEVMINTNIYMRKTILGLCIILITTLFQFESYGKDAPAVVRLSQSIEFDGYPYEDAWDGAEYFPLTMNRPNFGNEPAEKSEIMITYDNEYLWIGARLD